MLVTGTHLESGAATEAEDEGKCHIGLAHGAEAGDEGGGGRGNGLFLDALLVEPHAPPAEPHRSQAAFPQCVMV